MIKYTVRFLPALKSTSFLDFHLPLPPLWSTQKLIAMAKKANSTQCEQLRYQRNNYHLVLLGFHFHTAELTSLIGPSGSIARDADM